MSPTFRLRNRMRVLMHMVIALVLVILLAQLWLFTVTLQVMETRSASLVGAIAGLIVSFIGCAAVWTLIRFFLRAEGSQ